MHERRALWAACICARRANCANVKADDHYMNSQRQQYTGTMESPLQLWRVLSWQRGRRSERCHHRWMVLNCGWGVSGVARCPRQFRRADLACSLGAGRRPASDFRTDVASVWLV